MDTRRNGDAKLLTGVDFADGCDSLKWLRVGPL